MKATINGVESQYEVYGDGPRTLLCIHGFPLSGEMWAPLAKELHGSDNKLIVPDLRGLGRSQPVDTADMAQYADDLAALLDVLGETEPVVLLGLSMGGYVAFEFWRRWPQRVGAIVLADTRAEADTPEAAHQRETEAEKVLARGAGVVADAMLEKLFSPKASAGLKDEWHRIMSKTPATGMAAAMRAMAKRADSTPTLGRLNIPTLILVGEDDAITPPSLAQRMQEAIPGAMLEVIPAAGHLAPVEQPAAFAKALRRFLKTLHSV